MHDVTNMNMNKINKDNKKNKNNKKILTTKSEIEFLSQFSELILTCGMSYSEIAQQAGITVNTVYRYASDPPRVPQYVQRVLTVIGYKLLIVPVKPN